MDRKGAIEIVKRSLNLNARDAFRDALETLIPELEHEDVRIRKTLIRLFKEDYGQYYGGLTKEQILTWLKKQGEQKSSWSEEDDMMLDKIIDEVTSWGECPDYPTEKQRKFYEECNEKIEWLKSLKQKFHWKPSEEQINAFEHFVRSIGESGYASPYDNNTKLIYSLLDDLKKLL